MNGRRNGKNNRRQREVRRLLLFSIAIVALVFGAAFLAYLLFLRPQPAAQEASTMVTDAGAGTATPETVPFRAYGEAEEGQSEEEGASAAGEDSSAESAASATEGESAEDASVTALKETISAMTPEEKVAQLFLITPEQLTGYQQVTQCGDATYRALDRYPVGGLIYFANNLESQDQTRQMLQAVQTYATEQLGTPLFLAVDEEGGRVARVADKLENIPKTAPMAELARDGEETVYEAALVIGNYLSGLGFNLDFAPVADVLTNPENTAIGDRSFGEDAETVATMADAYMRGLSASGVIGVYKHFPGHGGTTEDTHDGYAYVDKPLEELKKTELVPFRDGMEKNAGMIMVAHVSLPQVTGNDMPATLSKEVVTSLLREDMGFDGVVVTDALNMGAIANHYSAAQSAVMALEAGCDILLMPSDFVQAYEAVLQAVRDGSLSGERIDESVLRILTLKQTLRR